MAPDVLMRGVVPTARHWPTKGPSWGPNRCQSIKTAKTG
jgi:hypothetical protein